MSFEPTRRTVLHSLAAGAVVIGFDPLARRWVPAGESTTSRSASGGGLDHVPPLDGTLLTDTASRADAADDFGHIVHRTPVAVLRPGSVADVVAMVKYANRHRLKVAARGQGHATFGQGQVRGGLVIETTPLARIGTVRGRRVTVGAGARWSTLARATIGHGLTPTVFTDYLELSVGGTLTVGGLGGQAHQHGAQVDSVTELRVVTGAGELERCSRTRRPDLFHAALAGLGQVAIIVEATLKLVPAPTTVRHYLLPYDDLQTFLDDQRTLALDRRFGYLEGQVVPDDQGSFTNFLIEAVAYGPPVGPAPDDSRLLRGLRHDPAGVEVQNLPYYDFLDRLAPAVAALKAAGLWDFAHPWLNLLVPGRRAAGILRPILDEVTPDDLGPGGLILLYPLVRRHLHEPLLRVPGDPVPYLMSALRTCPPDNDAEIRRLLAANRSAFEAVRVGGGTQYPVGSVPFTRQDWRRHFGNAYPGLAAARRRYDPRGLLTPGQGVF